MSKKVTKNLVLIVLCLSLVLSLAVFITSAKNSVKAEVDTESELILDDSAAIRKVSPVGIRFKTTISQSKYEEYLGKSATFGAILIPRDYLGANDFTLENSDVLDIPATNIAFVEDAQNGNYYTYTSVLVGNELADFPDDEYDSNILARAYVKYTDGVEKVAYSSTTTERSVAYVALQAMLNGESDDNDILKNILSKSEASKLEVPANVEISDTTLVWDTVENADEYIVFINGSEYKANTNSYDVSAYLDADYYIKVKASNSDIEEIASDYSDPIAYVAPTTGKSIAHFNNAAYETIVAESTYRAKFTKLISTEFVEAEEGEHDGAVAITLQKLVNGGTSNHRLAYFFLNLPRTITQTDFETYDGISIRFKIVESTDADLKFKLAVSNDTYDGYVQGSPAISDPTTASEWNTLYVDKATLKSIGLTGNISSLRLYLYKDGSCCGDGDGPVDPITTFLIDDVSFYNTLDVPANVKVNDTTLVWDTVEGASEYTVYVNGTENTVTTNSFDLTSYLSADYIIKVKAKSSLSAKLDSAYSDSIVCIATPTGKTIANFNTSAYESLGADPTVMPTYAKLSSATFIEAEESVHDGAVAFKVQKLINGTGNYRYYYFDLNLPRTITATDLASYEGFVIKYKFTYTQEGDYNFEFGVVSNTKKDYSTPINLQTNDQLWHELYVTKADLTTLGLTGDISSLTLMLYKAGSASTCGNANNYTTVTIDDISFYKPLDVPTNVKLQDTTLTWDAVEGASEYTVYVNGTENKATTNSFDVSAYLSGDYIFKVKAICSENEGLNSAYSKAVSYIKTPTGLTIADFNSYAYEATTSGPADMTKWSKYMGSEFVADGGESDGALAVTLQKLVNDNTQNYRQSYVNIALPRTITASDLATYDGIQIRLKVLTTTDGEGKDKKFHFGVNTGSFYAGGDSAVRVMNADLSDYVTLQCSTADLAKIGLTDNISTLQILFQKADPYCSGHGALSVDPITTFLIDDISFYVAE